MSELAQVSETRGKCLDQPTGLYSRFPQPTPPSLQNTSMKNVAARAKKALQVNKRRGPEIWSG